MEFPIFAAGGPPAADPYSPLLQRCNVLHTVLQRVAFHAAGPPVVRPPPTPTVCATDSAAVTVRRLFLCACVR